MKRESLIESEAEREQLRAKFEAQEKFSDWTFDDFYAETMRIRGAKYTLTWKMVPTGRR